MRQNRDGSWSEKIGYTDEFYSTDQHGFADADAYDAHKDKMLESVFQHGGFYVGKYETGIADTEPDVVDTNHEARTNKNQSIEDYTPVIQANAYPYNFVTNNEFTKLLNSAKNVYREREFFMYTDATNLNKKAYKQDKVIVQAGCTKYQSKDMKIFDLLDQEEFDQALP